MKFFELFFLVKVFQPCLTRKQAGIHFEGKSPFIKNNNILINWSL
jgi:hypothetical protein